jgi:hypothetical protein
MIYFGFRELGNIHIRTAAAGTGRLHRKQLSIRAEKLARAKECDGIRKPSISSKARFSG